MPKRLKKMTVVGARVDYEFFAQLQQEASAQQISMSDLLRIALTGRAKPKGVYRKKPLADRFWRFVDRKGENECWLWLGAKRNGYGVFALGHRVITAQRVAFLILYNRLPNVDELPRDPICKNRCCVNTEHWKKL